MMLGYAKQLIQIADSSPKKRGNVLGVILGMN